MPWNRFRNFATRNRTHNSDPTNSPVLGINDTKSFGGDPQAQSGFNKGFGGTPRERNPSPDPWFYPESEDGLHGGSIRMRESTGLNGVLDDQGNRLLIEVKDGNSWKRVSSEDEGKRILEGLQRTGGPAQEETPRHEQGHEDIRSVQGPEFDYQFRQQFGDRAWDQYLGAVRQGDKQAKEYLERLITTQERHGGAHPNARSR